MLVSRESLLAFIKAMFQNLIDAHEDKMQEAQVFSKDAGAYGKSGQTFQ